MDLYEAQNLCNLIQEESSLKPTCSQIGNGEYVVVLIVGGKTTPRNFFLWNTSDWETNKARWRARLYSVL